MKTYLLKPVVLDTTVAPNPFPGKPADPATDTLVAAILPPPTPPAPDGGAAAQIRKFIPLPPRQPLPQGVVDPARPLLKPSGDGQWPRAGAAGGSRLADVAVAAGLEGGRETQAQARRGHGDEEEDGHRTGATAGH